MRYTILRMAEPWFDFGYMPGGGAPLLGRGNGVFDWVESDGNGYCSGSEIHEPFEDLNGDGCRIPGDPVATRLEARDDCDLINAVWAQARLHLTVDLSGPGDGWWLSDSYVTIANDVPPAEWWDDTIVNQTFDFTDTNVDGVHDTGEGALEQFTDSNGNGTYDWRVNLDNWIDHISGRVTRETKNILDTFTDHNPDTLDIIVVNSLTNMNTLGTSWRVDTQPVIRRNSLMIRADCFGRYSNGVAKAFMVSGHEFGHIIMNQSGHYDDGYQWPGSDVTNLMNSAAAWPNNGDAINRNKRLRMYQVDDAQQDMSTANLRVP